MNWVIYIIFHRKINSDYYLLDEKFNYDNFKLLKTEGYIVDTFCEEQLKEYKQLGFSVLEENKFPIYNPLLQKNKYHAPSAIYHFYKNKAYLDLDYVGFMEYDIKLQLANGSSVIQFIEDNLNEGPILLSARHKYRFLSTQRDITINGSNCIPQIINHYNTFFRTEHTPQEVYDEDAVIGTQQSFICDRATFEKLGEFLEHLIEVRKDRYSPRPSTVFERYIGLFFHFQPNKIYLKLPHEAQGYHSGYRI